MSVAFIILVLQSSFFYAVYCVEEGEAGETGDTKANKAKVSQSNARDVFTAADLMSLFVRCALLVLCVVVDTQDLFSAWNIVEVGPQMLPSLAFTSLLMCTDFGETILENAIDTWTPKPENENIKYQLGDFEGMHDFIADTRLSTVNILFVAFLLLDACSVFVRSAFKIYNRYVGKDDTKKKENKSVQDTLAGAVVLPEELDPRIDLSTKKNG